jgi:cysteine desulfuration protein SufE
MGKSINQIQDELIEEFEFFDDWMEKYDYIISLGKNLPMIDQKSKNEDHIINGCQSKVWLDAKLDEAGLVNFYADSDAVITKGIISLLVKVLSGHKPEEIKQSELYFIDKIGLKQHLSPMRSNGLESMVKKMKTYGLAFSSIQKPSIDLDVIKQKVIEAVKTVLDPEIPADIYELGLIYRVDVLANGVVEIDMTLTSPMCPVADSMPMEVQEKVMAISGVKDVNLKVVFDPPWDKSKMSDEARLLLDMF